jgi:cyclopropane fatty-acyl-phospholipid synthase-like methyltransferase
VTSRGPVGGLIRQASRVRARLTFRGSAPYWEKRYASGGTSGAGSYGAAAHWKAEVVNRWVAENGVTSVLDLGCGDGNQLGLAKYPRYLGLDVSPSAVRRCIQQYGADSTKSFAAFDPSAWHDPAGWFRADLALSMEVIFHLVEDEVLDSYLHQLFDAAERFVVICAYDGRMPARAYEHHRPFTPWVAQHAPDWELVQHEQHPAEIDLLSDLYLYRRRT